MKTTIIFFCLLYFLLLNNISVSQNVFEMVKYCDTIKSIKGTRLPVIYSNISIDSLPCSIWNYSDMPSPAGGRKSIAYFEFFSDSLEKLTLKHVFIDNTNTLRYADGVAFCSECDTLVQIIKICNSIIYRDGNQTTFAIVDESLILNAAIPVSEFKWFYYSKGYEYLFDFDADPIETDSGSVIITKNNVKSKRSGYFKRSKKNYGTVVDIFEKQIPGDPVFAPMKLELVFNTEFIQERVGYIKTDILYNLMKRKK